MTLERTSPVKPEETTVLLAEDDPNDVLITRIMFRKARLANRLQVVGDGEQTIAYLQGRGRYADRIAYPRPILLLLDLKMPKISGFEVLEWMQDQPPSEHVPVAVLTSSTHDPFAERAFQLGADSYLVKPPTPHELLALVERLHAYWMIVGQEAELQPA